MQTNGEDSGATASTSAASLEALRTKQQDFANVVVHVIKSLPEEAPRVDFLCLRFREHQPEEEVLAEALWRQLVNYALPKRRIAQALARATEGGGIDASPFADLVAEARRAFISYNASAGTPQSEARYGEVGEIIAFCVASHHLEAAQIAAKMALKTNSEMPVFGLDGIHAALGSDGTLTLYCLESKLVGDPDGGANQYVASMSEFIQSRHQKLNELRIVRDMGNLDQLEGAAKEAALAYFDPYSEASALVRERYVGVIAYNEPEYGNGIPPNDSTPVAAHFERFQRAYAGLAPRIASQVKSRLERKQLELGICRAFFLALPDVSNLKRLFAKEMSGGGHVR